MVVGAQNPPFPFVVSASHGLFKQRALNRAAAGLKIKQVAQGQRRNPEAPVVFCLDKPFGGQPVETFPQRSEPDAIVFRQDRKAQRLPGPRFKDRMSTRQRAERATGFDVIDPLAPIQISAPTRPY